MRVKMRTLSSVLLLACLGLVACSQDPQDTAKETVPQVQSPMAPGWGNLDYTLPVAGSYQLHRLFTASGGEVTLSNGQSAELGEYVRDKITVLTFIYTSCNDANGCPLATFVLHALQKALHEREDLKGKVRSISLSFDSVNDTPEVMHEYGKDYPQKEGYEWLFMTTASEDKLQPILDSYGQYAFEMETEDGSIAFAHILRAYLIDAEGQIRNIYSVDFIHPQVLLTDIETLLLEEAKLRDLSSDKKVSQTIE